MRDKKNWDDFVLPNGKTIAFMREDNLDWWNNRGNFTDNPSARDSDYLRFQRNMKLNNPNFSIDSYKGKGLKIGEVCGGPYGGWIDIEMPHEDKYQIDIFANSFKDMGWFSSPPENTTWIEAPCEEIPLEDNFLDVVFGINSIDHGWDVFASINELLRVSKECYISFDTNRYLKPGYPDLNHYQIVKLEEVTDFMNENFSDNPMYEMKYLTWDQHNLKAFDYWIKKK